MRLRMLLPDPRSHPHSDPHADTMPVHEPRLVCILRGPVRKLQLPALRVLLQPARDPHPNSDSNAVANSDPHADTATATAYAHSYPHSTSYPYLHSYAYAHPDASPIAHSVSACPDTRSLA